jgi:lysozyme
LNKNKIYKQLLAMGLSGSLALGGAYLTAPSEGVVLGTYRDPVGIVTSCYGHTGPELRVGMKFTEEQCVEQLGKDLIKHDKQLQRVVKVDYLSPYMHAALVDFTFNVGIGNVSSSTLLRKLNNKEYEASCEQLTRWIYARQNGVMIVLKGLVIRRTNEYQWCMGNPPKEIKEIYEASR